MNVKTLVEGKRGCGYRKAGADGVGIYLMGEGIWHVCGKLPYALEVCPCCGGGIKQSRGFTWINPSKLFVKDPISKCEESPEHAHCLMNRVNLPVQAGLLWVGEKHYPTPQSFAREAIERGVSKKISAVPRDFKIGTHVIYMAHPKCQLRRPEIGENPEEAYGAGVFMAFRPTHIDLVIDDPENIPEKALNLKNKHGDDAQIVKIIRDIDQGLEI